MFAIYTPNGRSFYGSLEELRFVEKSQVLNATRKQRETDDPLTFGNKDYKLPPKAIKSYKEAIKQPEQKEPIRHASDLMSSPVHAISGNDTLSNAIRKFKHLPFQEFPVINSKNQLIGRLTRQQIYEYALKHYSVKQNIKKAKTVTELFLNEGAKVYVAEPVTDIRRIAALMIEHQLHTLPILENNGDIVGIISRTDIIKAVITEPPLSLWC